jgi:fermentation-respiration switch protein FrsA (DUF1100 family)
MGPAKISAAPPKTRGRIRYKLARFLLRGSVAFVLVSAIFIYFQDYLILPIIGTRANTLVPRDSNSLPKGIESVFIAAADGIKVEAWHAAGPQRDASERRAVLYFSGNGQPIESVGNLAGWFRKMGFSSYFLSYRGSGRSAGSPSEQGLYQDAEALWDYAARNEDLTAAQIVVFAHSLGSGPAAYIAQKKNPAGLVLLSPFVSLRTLVEEMFFYSLLSPFLRYELPVQARISGLQNTCVLLVHGEKDEVIPVAHSRELQCSYQGAKLIRAIYSAAATHNSILQHTQQDIERELLGCLTGAGYSSTR